MRAKIPVGLNGRIHYEKAVASCAIGAITAWNNDDPKTFKVGRYFESGKNIAKGYKLFVEAERCVHFVDMSNNANMDLFMAALAKLTKERRARV
jgi:hypothetical protein